MRLVSHAGRSCWPVSSMSAGSTSYTCSKRITTTSVIRCGSGGFWSPSRKMLTSSSLLVGLVERLLARVHDVVGIQRSLDRLDDLPGAAHLGRHELGVALAGRAVARRDRSAVLQGHL